MYIYGSVRDLKKERGSKQVAPEQKLRWRACSIESTPLAGPRMYTNVYIRILHMCFVCSDKNQNGQVMPHLYSFSCFDLDGIASWL